MCIHYEPEKRDSQYFTATLAYLKRINKVKIKVKVLYRGPRFGWEGKVRWFILSFR